jgi:Zn-dependent peptidase ImmA (M78 family)/transcriptional regulator with XRE-family HTH domain
MVERVDVNPRVLTWARKRAGLTVAALERRFPKLEEWESGALAPTRKQFEHFARATHVPTDWLFLDVPPVERVPIPDRRTLTEAVERRPSPDLLETIEACRQRQRWFQSFARTNREPRVGVVGSLSVDDDVVDAAGAMREALGFELGHRGPNYTRAIRVLAENAEDLGILVMVNGVVGSNTRRKLDPLEFRGFALAGPVAPVVFVNGADSKAVQVFTLAHELAHVWLGDTALSDADLVARPKGRTERWCAAVAGELLVPSDELAEFHDPDREVTSELDRLARKFKVSTLVALRRVHDAGSLGAEEYEDEFVREKRRVLEAQRKRAGRGGGNFYNTQPVRVSKRFARAIIGDALDGRTASSDACQMLGFRKESTLRELGKRLGVA